MIVTGSFKVSLEDFPPKFFILGRFVSIYGWLCLEDLKLSQEDFLPKIFILRKICFCPWLTMFGRFKAILGGFSPKIFILRWFVSILRWLNLEDLKIKALKFWILEVFSRNFYLYLFHHYLPWKLIFLIGLDYLPSLIKILHQ